MSTQNTTYVDDVNDYNFNLRLFKQIFFLEEIMIIFLSISLNICFGYPKESSH